MRTKLDGRVLVLPPELLEQVGIGANDEVDVTIERGVLFIRPVREHDKRTVEETNA